MCVYRVTSNIVFLANALDHPTVLVKAVYVLRHPHFHAKILMSS
jgi:hypothetical protein